MRSPECSLSGAIRSSAARSRSFTPRANRRRRARGVGRARRTRRSRSRLRGARPKAASLLVAAGSDFAGAPPLARSRRAKRVGLRPRSRPGRNAGPARPTRPSPAAAAGRRIDRAKRGPFEIESDREESAGEHRERGDALERRQKWGRALRDGRPDRCRLRDLHLFACIPSTNGAPPSAPAMAGSFEHERVTRQLGPRGEAFAPRGGRGGPARSGAAPAEGHGRPRAVPSRCGGRRSVRRARPGGRCSGPPTRRIGPVGCHVHPGLGRRPVVEPANRAACSAVDPTGSPTPETRSVSDRRSGSRGPGGGPGGGGPAGASAAPGRLGRARGVPGAGRSDESSAGPRAGRARPSPRPSARQSDGDRSAGSRSHTFGRRSRAFEGASERERGPREAGRWRDLASVPAHRLPAAGASRPGALSGA